MASEMGFHIYVEARQMKKTIVVGILGMVLISLVSAGLLDYFGKITGEVEVSGPVFYLDGEHEDGGVYHNLYVNELPEDKDIYFWNGHRLVFKTESLGVDEFYEARFEATIYMKSNNSGNTIQARFIKLDKDNHERTICEVEEVQVVRKTNFRAETFSCDSGAEIDFSEYDRIGIEIHGNGNESQGYWISTGDDSRTYGASRIEVSAV